MDEIKLELPTNNGCDIYDVFVNFMRHQFGGPNQQRTPTTDTCDRLAHYMRTADGEALCYELCREYITNKTGENESSDGHLLSRASMAEKIAKANMAIAREYMRELEESRDLYDRVLIGYKLLLREFTSVERQRDTLLAALNKARERIKYTDPKILAMEEIDQALESVKRDG